MKELIKGVKSAIRRLERLAKRQTNELAEIQKIRYPTSAQFKYFTISQFRWSYPHRKIEPGEISPWMSDRPAMIINHRAACPLCKFPLEVRLLNEKRMCKMEDIFIVDYEKRERLLVDCIKDKYERMICPEIPVVLLGHSINVSEELVCKIIRSCGKIRMCIPAKEGPNEALTMLHSYPGFFSMEINRLYNEWRRE